MKAELSDDTEGKPLGMKGRAALCFESCTVCMQAAELLAHDCEVGCMCYAINTVMQLIQLEQSMKILSPGTAACIISAEAMHTGNVHDNKAGPPSHDAICSSFTIFCNLSKI